MLRAKRIGDAEGLINSGSPSKDVKKSLQSGVFKGKNFRESPGKSEYYPLDYWFVFFVGFFVSYLIFSSPASDTMSKIHARGDILKDNKDSISTHDHLNYLAEKIQSCNVALVKCKNREPTVEAASPLQLQPEDGDAPPSTDKMQNKIMSLEISNKKLSLENSKLKAAKTADQVISRVRAKLGY